MGEMEQQYKVIYEEAVKKSAVNAENEFDYKKLEFNKTGLIDCIIKEEKEELLFTYNISGLKNLKDIRGEKKYKKLLVLLNAAELAALYKEYYFGLSDDNLYYDRYGQISVLRRDIYARGSEADEQQFIMAYKALVGYAMQKKYSYADYFDGGMDLLKKDKFLSQITKMERLSDITDFLSRAYEEEETASREKRTEVGKRWYRFNQWYILVSFLLILTLGACIFHLSFIQKPRTDAMLKGDNAFLESDYVKVIDSMEKVELKYMDKYKKYILAVAYVKGENLASEQKDNILSSLSVNGDEKLKDYWIHLGRLNTDEAENIALQRSDDQLLLYCYLTEKSIVEKNTELPGAEKTEQLGKLESKIEELAKQYEVKE